MVSVAGFGDYGFHRLNSIEVFWDGTASVATIPVGGLERFNGSFTVPADAVTGYHGIIMRVYSEWYDFDEGKWYEDNEDCPFTFTVISSTAAGGVQPDAYTGGVTTLPSTGLMSLLPLAGLAAASAGALLARNRRRQANNQL